MFCPRLDHFVRLNQNGTIGRCGHMIDPVGFESYDKLEESAWLQGVKRQMASGEWPKECVRCQQSEMAKGQSVRTNSISRHKILEPMKKDYLVVGGVLDNICNSACQSCSANLSTKIGSLESKNFKRVDNYVRFWELPQDRIVEIDVNGGEPTASKNYKKILKHIPANTKIVRMNTNGSRTIKELEDIMANGIKVIVTMSIDGVGSVHDYTRWPIKWTDYLKTVEHYKELRDRNKLMHLDMWTTVSCLNINSLPDIIEYTKSEEIPHDWAFLHQPSVLSVANKNRLTTKAKHLFPDKVAVLEDNSDALAEFITKQDALRGIDIKDYLSF